MSLRVISRMSRNFLIPYCLLTLLASTSHGCPATECECEYFDGKHTIDCTRRNLVQVPTFTASETPYDKLDLRGNAITAIAANAFAGLKLRQLDVTGNPIATIDDAAFVGLQPDLEALLLRMNRTTQFPTQALGELTNLRYLYTDNMDLSSIGLPPGAFASLVKLQSVNMSNCMLQSLPVEIFENQVNTLKELNLDQNDFRTIPIASIANVQALDLLSLVANRIEDIQSDTFDNAPVIRTLDITQNGINFIDLAAFASMANKLSELVMKTCQLTDQMLPPLEPLSTLTNLDISNNPSVANIHDGFFQNMVNLKTFSASGNSIQSISPAKFQGLGSLQTLNLGTNQISHIAENTFGATPSLTSLVLSQQVLSSLLDGNTFNGIQSSLTFLDLASTGLDDTKWSVVTPLTNLQSLWMGNNGIASIPDFTFKSLPNLQSVKLNNNQLTAVSQRNLYGMHDAMQTIDFSSNTLDTLGHCVFYQFTQVDYYRLGLNKNPLNCDCRLKWLLEALRSDPDYDTKKYTVQWKCSLPASLDGELFVMLGTNNLTCDPPTTEEPCQSLAPTTTTTTTTTTSTTTAAPPTTIDVERSFAINITEVSDTAITITWTISSVENVGGFKIEYHAPEDEESKPVTLQVDMNTRSLTITGLEPATTYLVCVEVITYSTWTSANRHCNDVLTMPAAAPVTDDSKTLPIVLGCVFGFIGLVVIVVIVLLFIRRQHGKSSELPSRAKMPTAGYGSKRFQKPKPSTVINLERNLSRRENADNTSHEAKLEGFSRDERDRILNMWRRSGGSTLSMNSATSDLRYVPELPPRPPEMPGYLNPVGLQDELDDPSKHIYCEIPGDKYDRIPADDTFI